MDDGAGKKRVHRRIAPTDDFTPHLTVRLTVHNTDRRPMFLRDTSAPSETGSAERRRARNERTRHGTRVEKGAGNTLNRKTAKNAPSVILRQARTSIHTEAVSRSVAMNAPSILALVPVQMIWGGGDQHRDAKNWSANREAAIGPRTFDNRK